MYDLYKVGGTPAVLKALLEAGLLHGDCLTCTGATLAENLKPVRSIYERRQSVVRPLNDPMHPSGHIVILHGNLAPEGAVAKVAGLKQRRMTGPCAFSTARKPASKRSSAGPSSPETLW